MTVVRTRARRDAHLVPEPDEQKPMGFADLDAGASRSVIQSTGLLLGIFPALLLLIFVVAAVQGWGPL
jgi:hypothetical protein